MLFSDYVRLVRRSLPLLWVLALLGGAAGLGWSILQPPQYQSTTTLFVSARQAANLADLSQGADFAQELVRSYAAIVPTAAVLDPAMQRAGVKEDLDTLAKNVQATTPLDTVVLQITVTDTSPTRAARLANAIGDSLSDVVDQVTPPTADTAVAVRLLTMQEGRAPTAPTSPRILLNVAIGFAVGLAIGAIVVLARDAVRRQDQDRSAQLERFQPRRRTTALPDPSDPSRS